MYVYVYIYIYIYIIYIYIYMISDIVYVDIAHLPAWDCGKCRVQGLGFRDGGKCSVQGLGLGIGVSVGYRVQG